MPAIRGVKVCFKTNSPLLAVKADYIGFGRTTHNIFSGSAGINIMVSENGGPLKFADFIGLSFNKLGYLKMAESLSGMLKPFLA